MSDPVEVLLNSPRSKKAMEKLGFNKEDLRYFSKDELKAKIGNMKITKQELDKQWDKYESERKDKISQVLEVSNRKDQFYSKVSLKALRMPISLTYIFILSAEIRNARNL